MKEPWEWTEKDLQQMVVDNIEENLHLDFKDSDALNNPDKNKVKRDLSKDVSAFANSDGGTLLYGIHEDKSKKTIHIDAGIDSKQVTKEWLEQIINGNIQRRINGIRIAPIPLSNGNVAYSISIPRSTLAPHMNIDKKYYKRFNFESVPMEEYEVRDVSNRNVAPDLEFHFSLSNLESGPSYLAPFQQIGDGALVRLYFQIKNNSPAPALYSLVDIYVDDAINSSSRSGVQSDGTTVDYHIDGYNILFSRLFANYNIPNYPPILHDMTFVPYQTIINLVISDRIKRPIYLGWRLRSPAMSTREGFAKLHLYRDRASLTAIPIGQVTIAP